MPDRVGVTQIELRVVPREAITRLSARQAARRRRQRDTGRAARCFGA